MQGSSKPLMGVRSSHGLPILLLLCIAFNSYAFMPIGIHNYIPNFPELSVSIFYVSDVDTECRLQSNNAKDTILGCSKISFENKTCKIYVSKHSPSWVLKHEEAHCMGGDHNNVLLNGFNRYLKSQTESK